MNRSTVSKKALVVDDEEDIGFLMRLLLRPEGFEVVHVKNLTDAKEALNGTIFHTVFLDLNLDHEFGLDLVPHIRRQDYRANIAVITAQKEPKVLDKVRNSDVDFLIEKPFDRQRIMKILNSST